MSGARLLERVLARCDAALSQPPLCDNVDPERFPDGMAAVTPAQTRQRTEHLLSAAERWEWLADTLDGSSVRLLEALLSFHLLGQRHVRVGPPVDEVRARLAEADEQLIVGRDVTRIPYAGSPATHRFNLSPIGFDIELESYMLGVQGTFQLQQYASPGHPEARPAAGDVAIDAGGCFGETALWLAHRVGATGRVQTLEFAPANLAILRANLADNPRYADRIAVTEAALWERRARLTMERGGPASTVAGASGGAGTAGVAGPAGPAGTREVGSVAAVGLDELVAEAELARVDFLKLDIEGAEPAALRGAPGTLERWRPKLALAAYHDIDHLWQLPWAVAQLGLGYRFALGHFTMHAEETVLYGWVP